MSYYVYIDPIQKIETSRCYMPDADNYPNFYKIDKEAFNAKSFYYLNSITGEMCVTLPKPSHLHKWDNVEALWIVDIERLSEDAKVTRSSLLKESDWTDTFSAKTRLGDLLYNQWQEYRQALRDIPQQKGFPENIIWPDKPQQG